MNTLLNIYKQSQRYTIFKFIEKLLDNNYQPLFSELNIFFFFARNKNQELIS